mmetsp:Transcript_23102/g.87392  ORF Transcript_23102/g.87392 Transcript_23102/m.87392 type:complete len:359 (+) Transcript_23102:2048-3124(+)
MAECASRPIPRAWPMPSSETTLQCAASACCRTRASCAGASSSALGRPCAASVRASPARVVQRAPSQRSAPAWSSPRLRCRPLTCLVWGSRSQSAPRVRWSRSRMRAGGRPRTGAGRSAKQGLSERWPRPTRPAAGLAGLPSLQTRLPREALRRSPTARGCSPPRAAVARAAGQPEVCRMTRSGRRAWAAWTFPPGAQSLPQRLRTREAGGTMCWAGPTRDSPCLRGQRQSGGPRSAGRPAARRGPTAAGRRRAQVERRARRKPGGADQTERTRPTAGRGALAAGRLVACRLASACRPRSRRTWLSRRPFRFAARASAAEGPPRPACRSWARSTPWRPRPWTATVHSPTLAMGATATRR